MSRPISTEIEHKQWWLARSAGVVIHQEPLQLAVTLMDLGKKHEPNPLAESPFNCE